MKNYLIRNWVKLSDGGSQDELIFIHDTKELLKWQDKHREAKYSVYECECIVDWS